MNRLDQRGFEDRYDSKEHMPYITSIERHGMAKGLKKGLEQGLKQGLKKGRKEGRRQGLLVAIKLGLEIKFGDEGLRVFAQIRNTVPMKKLQAIRKALPKLSNLEELQSQIDA